MPARLALIAAAIIASLFLAVTAASSHAASHGKEPLQPQKTITGWGLAAPDLTAR